MGAARKTRFVRGDGRLMEILSRPDLAARVAEVEREMRELDRNHAEHLTKTPEANPFSD